jgi:DMSO/TMAO reductase YedYZ molybdopterin-dependent catalytic subunit
MLHRIAFVILVALLLAACAGPAATAGGVDTSTLTVTDGSTEVTYTADDLQALETSQADFMEVQYEGVPLATLLRDAGFDPQSLTAVKATALDGFSANYDPDQVNASDTLVSYARVDGPLAEDEGPFRMVLPNAEGKMNPRQVIEIRVIP